MKITNQPIFEIGYNADGELETKVSLFEGFDVIRVGMALASATRVATHALKHNLNLKEFQIEQIEAAVQEVYNNDLKMGDNGEGKTTTVL